MGVWSGSLPREEAAKNYLRSGEQGSAATCSTRHVPYELIVANSGSAGGVEAHLLAASETPVGPPMVVVPTRAPSTATSSTILEPSARAVRAICGRPGLAARSAR